MKKLLRILPRALRFWFLLFEVVLFVVLIVMGKPDGRSQLELAAAALFGANSIGEAVGYLGSKLEGAAVVWFYIHVVFFLVVSRILTPMLWRVGELLGVL